MRAVGRASSARSASPECVRHRFLHDPPAPGLAPFAAGTRPAAKIGFAAHGRGLDTDAARTACRFHDDIENALDAVVKLDRSVVDSRQGARYGKAERLCPLLKASLVDQRVGVLGAAPLDRTHDEDLFEPPLIVAKRAFILDLERRNVPGIAEMVPAPVYGLFDPAFVLAPSAGDGARADRDVVAKGFVQRRVLRSEGAPATVRVIFVVIAQEIGAARAVDPGEDDVVQPRKIVQAASHRHAVSLCGSVRPRSGRCGASFRPEAFREGPAWLKPASAAALAMTFSDHRLQLRLISMKLISLRWRGPAGIRSVRSRRVRIRARTHGHVRSSWARTPRLSNGLSAAFSVFWTRSRFS